jgi:hypothetical protein
MAIAVEPSLGPAALEKLIGVNRGTISTWMTKDSKFRTEVEHCRREFIRLKANKKVIIERIQDKAKQSERQRRGNEKNKVHCRGRETTSQRN